MILLIIVSVIIILLSLWYLHYYSYDKYLKHIDGPRPLPLFGNTLEFTSTSDLLPTILRIRKKFGSVIKVYIGFAPPAIGILDTNFLEFVLGSTRILEKTEDYNFFSRWLGTGLLTSGAEKWKKHRKILTPAFHFQILEQFVEVFEFYSNILVKKLESQVGKKSVNIYNYITLCSLDIICASAMGTKVNAQENSESKYVYSVKEMCRIVIERLTSLTKMFDLLYQFSKDYQKETEALDILHGYTNSVIQSRKQEVDKSNNYNQLSDVDDIGRKKRKTFLDLLLQYKKDGQPISDVDIREEVDTFMFEGHDTTASAISFALYCLAKNQDVQEKVLEELQTIYADDKHRLVTYRDLQEMKYLEATIKETLRLYPSVPVFGRRLLEDIEYDGHIYPKGLRLGVVPFLLHREPDIYPDPERFDPERFSLENQAKRSPYAYIPFSAGPRNCIGQRFAMMEMKSVISKILRNYELIEDPDHELLLVPETILKSKTGVCIGLKKRNF